MRAHEREMTHPHPSTAVLIDQRDRGKHIGAVERLACKPQVLLVDTIDDLQVSG